MDAFSEFLKNINDALLSLYNQKFRQQETVLAGSKAQQTSCAALLHIITHV